MWAPVGPGAVSRILVGEAAIPPTSPPLGSNRPRCRPQPALLPHESVGADSDGEGVLPQSTWWRLLSLKGTSSWPVWHRSPWRLGISQELHPPKASREPREPQPPPSAGANSAGLPQAGQEDACRLFSGKASPSECSRIGMCRTRLRGLGSTTQGRTLACWPGSPMTQHAWTTWTGSDGRTTFAARPAVQRLGGDLPTVVGRAGAALAECRRRPAPSSTAHARLSRSGSRQPGR